MYRGKCYHLCTCQSTLSFPVGKKENLNHVYQNSLFCYDVEQFHKGLHNWSSLLSALFGYSNDTEIYYEYECIRLRVY